MPSKSLRELLITERAYIAGLFDGEGTVAIYETTVGKRQNNPRPAFIYQAQIANTNWKVISYLCLTVGGTWAKKSRGKAHWRTGYVWRITGEEAALFFAAILDFSIIKRDEIEMALAFRKMLTPRNKRQTDDMIEARRGVVRQLKVLKHAQ